MTKHVFSLAAALLLLSGWLLSLAAQESRPSPPSGTAQNQQWEIITRYLPEENRTVVMIRKMRFFGGSYDDHLTNHCDPLLVAEFSYEGKRPQVPEVVALSFIAYGFQERELVVMADDERIGLGRLTQSERFQEHNDCRGLIRTYGTLIPRETFMRMVNAQRIEVRVGDEALPFDEDHRQALRALASRMR